VQIFRGVQNDKFIHRHAEMGDVPAKNKMHFTFAVIILLSNFSLPTYALDAALSNAARIFQQADKKLTTEQQLDFYVGQSFAQKPWVIAPSTTTSRDGLGPLYNASSCVDCHHRNGKASLLSDENIHNRIVRIGDIHTADINRKLGDQLQTRAIPDLEAEASVSVSYTESTLKLSDGEVITLKKPRIHLKNTILPASTPISMRTPSTLIGMGLLEAIKADDLLALADPKDANNDGISGKVNWVDGIQGNKKAIGRFGWKAGQPSVKQQVAAAFVNDMGITSSIFMQQPCTTFQTECAKAFSGGDHEISDNLLDKVTLYIQTIAVPQGIVSANSTKGEVIFHQVGCALCHTPQFITASPNAALNNRIITPYSDLLLHDMGEGLADYRDEFDATGNEWRTPPLWGLSWVEKQGVPIGYLHDGRASTLIEAILWHDGEAKASREAVVSLPKEQRQWLIEFLQSL
jgi:CxxC motif-containing protein (DUF1111 family)